MVVSGIIDLRSLGLPLFEIRLQDMYRRSPSCSQWSTNKCPKTYLDYSFGLLLTMRLYYRPSLIAVVSIAVVQFGFGFVCSSGGFTYSVCLSQLSQSFGVDWSFVRACKFGFQIRVGRRISFH